MIIFSCRSKTPDDIKIIIQHTQNKLEIKKAVNHYNFFLKDSLKLKAIYFLLRNMEGKGSFQFHMDFGNSKIPKKNFVYEFFKPAYKGIQYNIKEIQFKKKYPNFEFVLDSLINDLQHITANQLINNIDNAFEVWHFRNNRKISFDEFCEYILPYRSEHEPLSNWRGKTKDEVNKWLNINNLNRKQIVSIINDSLRKQFVYHAARGSFFPTQLSLDEIKMLGGGSCEDLVTVGSYSFRSVGIPITNEFTPCWGSIIGIGHTWLSFLNEKGKFIPFNPCEKNTYQENDLRHKAHFAKIFRQTFQLQKNSLANINKDKYALPNFLNRKDFIDITKERIPVKNIRVRLDKNFYRYKYAYIGVAAGMGWKVVHWAEIDKHGFADFKDMGLNILYMPLYFNGVELIPAGNPFFQSDTGKQLYFFKKNDKKFRNVKLKPKMNYMFGWLKPDSIFELYQWKYNNWVKIKEAKANPDSSIVYHNLSLDKLYTFRKLNDRPRSTLRPFTVRSGSVQVF